MESGKLRTWQTKAVTILQFAKMNVPSSFKELFVYCVWAHSVAVAKFSNWPKPYKSGYLFIWEVAEGGYVGKATMAYAAGIWASLGTAVLGLALILVG